MPEKDKTNIYSPTGHLKKCRKCGKIEPAGIIICHSCGYDFTNDLPKIDKNKEIW